MPSKMDEILKLADYHGIPVIEDAAESFGSTYKTRHAGTLGSLGIYSFNNNKVLTTYGGGAIVTKKAEWAAKARFLSSQARENLPYYEHRQVGHNYAISPLSAAAGLSQLPDLDERIEKRRSVFDQYKAELTGLDVQFQPESALDRSNRWFSTLLFKDEPTKLHVTSVLENKGIETRPLWRPMHQQPVYQLVRSYLNGISDRFFKTGLCLPSGNGTEGENQEKVIKIVKKSLS
jgi:UDP-N-acetylbacillosamine transaminase